MGSILGSIRPYLALWAASTPQRDKNRARLTKFLRFDPAQCELKTYTMVRTVLGGNLAVFSESLVLRRIFNGTQVQT